MDQLKFEMSFEWEAVCHNESVPYQFPSPITPDMQISYKMPAVYRWHISLSDQPEQVYIGETAELCPKRLSQYCKPDSSQQTNLRIHQELQKALKQGAIIRLAFLRFDRIRMNELTITPQDLNHSYIRKFLENLCIIDHRQKHIHLLNLL